MLLVRNVSLLGYAMKGHAGPQDGGQYWGIEVYAYDLPDAHLVASVDDLLVAGCKVWWRWCKTDPPNEWRGLPIVADDPPVFQECTDSWMNVWEDRCDVVEVYVVGFKPSKNLIKKAMRKGRRRPIRVKFAGPDEPR